MPESVTEPSAKTTPPDYEKMIRFLIHPFLESPEELKLDCEVSQSKPRILIRAAFEGSDKGRVFGRGGRNIQAIRSVLEAIAQLSGYSIHLEVFGTASSASGDGGDREPPDRSGPRRSSPPRPAKPRR